MVTPTPFVLLFPILLGLLVHEPGARAATFWAGDAANYTLMGQHTFSGIAPDAIGNFTIRGAPLLSPQYRPRASIALNSHLDLCDPPNSYTTRTTISIPNPFTVQDGVALTDGWWYSCYYIYGPFDAGNWTSESLDDQQAILSQCPQLNDTSAKIALKKVSARREEIICPLQPLPEGCDDLFLDQRAYGPIRTHHSRDFFLKPSEGRTTFVFQNGTYDDATEEKQNDLYDSILRQAWVVRALWGHFRPDQGDLSSYGWVLAPTDYTWTTTVLRPNYINNGSRDPLTGTVVYPPMRGYFKENAAALNTAVVSTLLLTLATMGLQLVM